MTEVSTFPDQSLLNAMPSGGGPGNSEGSTDSENSKNMASSDVSGTKKSRDEDEVSSIALKRPRIDDSNASSRRDGAKQEQSMLDPWKLEQDQATRVGLPSEQQLPGTQGTSGGSGPAPSGNRPTSTYGNPILTTANAAPYNMPMVSGMGFPPMMPPQYCMNTLSVPMSWQAGPYTMAMKPMSVPVNPSVTPMRQAQSSYIKRQAQVAATSSRDEGQHSDSFSNSQSELLQPNQQDLGGAKQPEVQAQPASNMEQTHAMPHQPQEHVGEQQDYQQLPSAESAAEGTAGMGNQTHSEHPESYAQPHQQHQQMPHPPTQRAIQQGSATGPMPPSIMQFQQIYPPGRQAHPSAGGMSDADPSNFAARNRMFLSPFPTMPGGLMNPFLAGQMPRQRFDGVGPYMSQPAARSNGISLALSCDDEQLSEYQILVRKQLEIFEAQQEDVESNTQGRKKPVVKGQVGIRCRHCACFPLRQRGKGAVYYPTRLHGVYQAAQNMASSHLGDSCQCIPHPLKQELRILRERRDTASGGKQYWADGARAMGLYETEEGLRLRQKGSL